MGPISPSQIQKNLFSQMGEKNLERMRNQSDFGKQNSEKGLEKVARDFESVFLNKLLESMRKTIPKSGLLESFSTDMFQSMLDEEMSKEMAKNKGMGMGEMIYNDLGRMNRVLRGETIKSSYTDLKSDPTTYGIKLEETTKSSHTALPINPTTYGIKLKE